jgi:hypothetical protein
MVSAASTARHRDNINRKLRLKLGKYIFEIIGQKRINLHGLNTSKDPYNLVYIQTFTLDGAPILRDNGTTMIFSVYNSESQAGFCRLASIDPADGTFVKGDDYAQTTVIHFKLGRFILNALQRGGIITTITANPYSSAKMTMGDVKREHRHVDDASRPIRGRGFGAVGAPQEACGKFTPRIAEYLQQTADQLQQEYPTVIDVEFVCSHVFNTGAIAIRGRIFKIGLRGAGSNDGEIEIYVFKYTCRKIDAGSDRGTALSPRKYSFISSSSGACIPVLIKRRTLTAEGGADEDVTAFGTFANYIPGFGAYVCKIFEYTLQLPRELTEPGSESELPKINDMYTYIGNLYARLYPAAILDAALDAKRVFLPSRARGASLSRSVRLKRRVRSRSHNTSIRRKSTGEIINMHSFHL